MLGESVSGRALSICFSICIVRDKVVDLCTLYSVQYVSFIVIYLDVLDAGAAFRIYQTYAKYSQFAFDTSTRYIREVRLQATNEQEKKCTYVFLSSFAVVEVLIAE